MRLTKEKSIVRLFTTVFFRREAQQNEPITRSQGDILKTECSTRHWPELVAATLLASVKPGET